MIDFSIIGPALIVGFLILCTHVPLGQTVLARGIIFIDLAIAQWAAIGVLAASFIQSEPSWWLVQVSAACAALLAATVLSWTDRRWPKKQEALIGTFFVLGATSGLLLLANNPNGGEHLKDLLDGQILWILWEDLWRIAGVTIGVLVLLRIFKTRSRALSFYVPFAIAVTLSVQLVGVYLVFASLIVPALATSHLTGVKRIVVAVMTGFAGYFLGLIVSSITDLPSGAVIVWMIALTGFFPQFIGVITKGRTIKDSLEQS